MAKPLFVRRQSRFAFALVVIARTAALALAFVVVAGSRLAYAQAQTFTNARPIPVADATADGPGVGDPNPSVITVPSGLGGGGTLRRIVVRLDGFTHERPADFDILLVPPAASGRAPVLLLSDHPMETMYDVPLTFHSDSTDLVGTDVVTINGHRPTNVGDGDIFPGLPAVTPSTDLQSLYGIDPAGDWQLRIVDDETGETGQIANGWWLSLEAGHTVAAGPGLAIGSPPAVGAVQHAVPFPSTLAVAGFTGAITSLRIDLLGVTHTRPRDLEIVVKSPWNRCAILASDAGGDTPAAGVNLGFDSVFQYIPALPLSDPFTSGVFVQRNYPDSPGEVDMSAGSMGCLGFDGISQWHGREANGVWSIYASDDAPGEDGSIAGWQISFATAAAAPELTITDPAGAIPDNSPAVTLSGTVMAGAVPLSEIRYRLEAYENLSFLDPDVYVEGPWQPLAPDATTWTIPDVPLPYGRGTIVVEVRDLSGLVDSASRAFANPLTFYTLSEGATGPFFDLDVAIFNPNDVPVQANVRYMLPEGPQQSQTLEIPAGQRLLVSADAVPGLESTTVSTLVVAPAVTPLVVERTMFWGETRYGGHASGAVEPTYEWYFAEGSQGFFQTYLLLVNPGEFAARVEVHFLVENGPPVDLDVWLAPRSRQTIDVSTIPELASASFGIAIESTFPIVPERAMYFSNGSRLWEGGHESTGASELATRWLLAEGATGSFFTTYVLVANPFEDEAVVTMTYLTTSGQTITRTHPIASHGRLTINIAGEAPELANATVSTMVESTVPVVVERAMYWPGYPAEWTEAHASTAVSDPSVAWGIADGRVGGAQAFSTFILVANPNAEPAEIDVRLVGDNGSTLTQQVTVAGHSRHTLDVSALAAGAWPIEAGVGFAATLRATNGVPIAVERATYWNADGLFWSGGAAVVATRLP